MGGANVGHDGDPHTCESGNEATGSTDDEADAGRNILEVTDGGKKN